MFLTATAALLTTANSRLARVIDRARGLMRVQGLAGVWLAASRSWADDNSLDLGPTMAALDKALDRAEQIARTLRLDDGDLSAAGHGGIVPGQDAAPSPPAGTDPMLG